MGQHAVEFPGVSGGPADDINSALMQPLRGWRSSLGTLSREGSEGSPDSSAGAELSWCRTHPGTQTMVIYGELTERDTIRDSQTPLMLNTTDEIFKA